VIDWRYCAAASRCSFDGEFDKPTTRAETSRNHHAGWACTAARAHRGSLGPDYSSALRSAAKQVESWTDTRSVTVQRRNARCLPCGARDSSYARAVTLLLPLRSGLRAQESLQLL